MLVLLFCPRLHCHPNKAYIAVPQHASQHAPNASAEVSGSMKHSVEADTCCRKAPCTYDVVYDRCMPTLWSLAGSWGGGRPTMMPCHAYTSPPTTVSCSPAPGTAQSNFGSKRAQPCIHPLGMLQLGQTCWARHTLHARSWMRIFAHMCD